MTDIVHLQNDSMYGAVLRHETAGIDIALGPSVMNPETTLTQEELDSLQSILVKLTNRDISISVAGWKFDGYVRNSFVYRDEGQPFLRAIVQF